MRTYNDPIHGRQVILSDVAEALFQHPALLQLMGKKQLAMKDRLFANATHTRYIHSVGTLITAQRVAESLGLPDKEAKLLQAAGALHDIGHYPFSHATEKVCGTHHEEIPQIVLRGEDFGAIKAEPLLATLKRLDIDPAEVAQVLRGEHKLSALISHKVVDIDRIDYLARDFHACGVSFGADIDRLIGTLTFEDGQLGVTRSGVVSLTSFMVARALAYDQIYMHRRVEVAETMLQVAIQSDPDLGDKSRQSDEAIHRMSDHELLARLEKSSSAFTRDLAQRLRKPVGGWYIPVLELGGEEDAERVLALYRDREAVERRLQAEGLLWSWNATPRLAKRKEPVAFPVSDGSDLFDRKLCRAAWEYVPERLLTIYGPTGSDAEREAARASLIAGR